jgi:hypothetical protein
MAEREDGFYWVRIFDEWTVAEWCDSSWWVVGNGDPWWDPVLGGAQEPKLDEIGPRIDSYTGEWPHKDKSGRLGGEVRRWCGHRRHQGRITGDEPIGPLRKP